MGSFEDGREFEGLVRQIKAIYSEVEKAKEREERRLALRSTLDNIFLRVKNLAEEYGITNNEIREIHQLYASCINEQLYQNYKAKLK